MLRKINLQREANTVCYHIYLSNKQRMIAKQKQNYACREKNSGYQQGEGIGEGQDSVGD